MNLKQRKVLLVGAAAIALMLLFPPWDYFDNDSSGRSPAGYHFFLTPPEPKPVKEIFRPPRFPHMAIVYLNDARLIVQLLIAIPTILGLAILFKAKRSVVSLGLGILLISCAVLVIGFMAWLVISVRVDYGYWALP
jgi:hypothetical protein